MLKEDYYKEFSDHESYFEVIQEESTRFRNHSALGTSHRHCQGLHGEI